MANIRKMWEGEDEEALRQELLSKDEGIIKNQLIYIREMVSDIENEKWRYKTSEYIVNTF